MIKRLQEGFTEHIYSILLNFATTTTKIDTWVIDIINKKNYKSKLDS